MTPEGAFDFRRILTVFAHHRVEFVLIGGLAGRLHGSTIVTNDVDVCYSRTDENLQRLAEALRELEATLRGAPKDVPFILDAKSLRMGDHFTFDTVAGALDILGTPSGSRGYDIMRRTAVDMDVDEFVVHVASLDDLISMKIAAGRAKDLEAVETLGALRDLIDEEER